MFLLKFEQRTVYFDIYVGVALLGKTLLGLLWYSEKSLRQLRIYMSYRYLYNAGALGLPTVLFHLLSKSYPVNYIALTGAITVSELIMLLIYCTHLCQIKVEETIESIEGFKLTNRNLKAKSLLGQCDIKVASTYLNSKQAGYGNALTEKQTRRQKLAEASWLCSNFARYPVIEFQDDLNKRA